MRLVATTAVGLEPLLSEELVQAGVAVERVPVEARGLVAFRGPRLEGVPRLMAWLRTVDRVGVLLGTTEADPGDPWPALEGAVRSLGVEEWLAPGGAFAVRCRRVGEPPVRSLEVERRIGDAVGRVLEGAGRRPRVDLEAPDLLLRVHVDGACRAAFWVDLVGPVGLHRRGHRRYAHPAAMRSTIAAALLQAAGLRPGDAVADPFCGGGTLPVEAAWMAHGVPVTALREEGLALWRLPPFQGVERVVGQEDGWMPGGRHEGSKGHVWAGDLSPVHLDGARRNAEHAGVTRCIRFRRRDVRRMAQDAGLFRVVATDPPFGVRSGRPYAARVLHEALMEQALQVLEQGGVLGLLSPRRDWVREAAGTHGLRVGLDLGVHHGRLPIRLMVLWPQ